MFSKTTVKTLVNITLFVVLLLDNNCHTRAFLLNMSRNLLQTQKVQNISLKKRSQSILLGEVSDWSSTAVQYSQRLWNLLKRSVTRIAMRISSQHPWNFPHSTGSAWPWLPHLLNKSFSWTTANTQFTATQINHCWRWFAFAKHSARRAKVFLLIRARSKPHQLFRSTVCSWK